MDVKLNREKTDDGGDDVAINTSSPELNLPGSVLFDGILNTDSNDDTHTLSPFNKRTGNVTDNNTQQQQDHHSPNITTSPPLKKAPLPPNKKPPMPQLVGKDGLPIPSASPMGQQLLTHGPITPHGNRELGKDSRIPFGDGPYKLPSYLKDAPPCASLPTNKSFCLMPHGYPSEVSSELVRLFKDELSEVHKILQLSQLLPDSTEPIIPETTTVSTSVECETEERTVNLSWSQDVLGNWFVILQTEPFLQPTKVITCSNAARLKGCRPLLRPRLLLALQPFDPEPRPLALEFPLPEDCIFTTAGRRVSPGPP